MIQCKRLLKEENCIECFIPRCEVQKRYQGNLYMEKRIIFLGYVFFECEQIEELYLELKVVPELTDVLEMERNWFPCNLMKSLPLKRFVEEPSY